MTDLFFLYSFSTAEPESSADDSALLIFLLVLALAVSVLCWIIDYFNKQKKEQNEKKFETERMQIKKSAPPFFSSPFVNALFLQIRLDPDLRKITRIDIRSDRMTLTLAGSQTQKDITFHSLYYKNLAEENRIPVACALAVKLGPPFHIAFQEGQPTALLTVKKDHLIDPNTEKREPQKRH